MKYLHALNCIPGLGPQKMARLVNHFESGEAAWNASRVELIKAGISEQLAQTILETRPLIDIDARWEELEKHNIGVLARGDEQYPNLLAQIHHPPYLLYQRGTANFNQTTAIAIVGSRKYTDYGQQAATALARDLAQAGITVVSGLALGIDAFAHRGALNANGHTIAVLGNSLDDASIAPRTNFNLAKEILESGGALISEYPPVTAASPLTFPARNRIIAGITQGTIVVEAAMDSGSLITAKYALEWNRDIYAVPGSIFSPFSEGTHDLIKTGAKLITSVADILEELSLGAKAKKTKPKELTFDSAEEAVVYNLLSHEPIQVDQLIEKSKLSAPIASATLAMLEMKGIIKNIGGQKYIKI